MRTYIYIERERERDVDEHLIHHVCMLHMYICKDAHMCFGLKAGHSEHNARFVACASSER